MPLEHRILVRAQVPQPTRAGLSRSRYIVIDKHRPLLYAMFIVMKKRNKRSHHPEIRAFSYISGIFKYIESYHLMGHQIGRKVGDMLELIVMGKIFSDPELKKRVMIEPKVLGITGAGHKVEFGFYEDKKAKKEDLPFGIIECKKVGVEVTKSNSVRSSFLTLGISHDMTLSFNPNWVDKPFTFNFKVKKINNKKVQMELKVGSKTINQVEVGVGETLKIALDEDRQPFFLGPQQSLRDVDGVIRLCRIIKLQTLTDTLSTWGVYDCLTGPQTIEKAKQAALVAMDVRRKVDGKWGKEDIKEEDKHVISILVLTEASHWESKSRKVITTCIDHNIIVPDEIIVSAFKEFEGHFGLADMLPLIAKNIYLENIDVQKIINKIVASNKNRLFYDLDLGSYVDFEYKKGRLAIKPISS